MMMWTAPDPAPNPRRVRLFLGAKGLTIPETSLSLLRREHKSAETLARNPRGQVPFLELDDGRVIAETVSICRYLDELYPDPPLFGTTPLARAETDMWIRRVETALGIPLSLAWQHGHPLTAGLVAQIPAMADQARARFAEASAWFDTQLNGRQWLAGDGLTMADITLLSTLDFATLIGLPIADDLASLRAWHARATAALVAEPK
ncbi:glutathione S-transferase family protein [Polymorphobacter fuscus]|uniref:Glutathione S-transferase n=1 Tax=Sandarakinorhabdus fusca TaxID=1439888 RepID=A0A7C9GMP8_9SPHN|nr:glutathione S-transferase family protein [Polymorphobacter fuscus]KAB7648536.1 glutathione S-transferase family protein [Polymorphobacter fuscus]MQT16075.1 glutathione S-transferase [Polymorphobacter fuscus]NJC07646.1 glutathione S-transferase [Polymorphobacter fuscus]